MNLPLVIVGCGGFGREVFAIIQALRAAGKSFDVTGFIDDCPSDSDTDRVRALGSSVIGTVADLARWPSPYSAVIAIGSAGVKRRIHAALSSSAVVYPRLVHPDSTLGNLVVLGEGVVIAAGTRLSTNITIGAQVHLDQNATVGHDSTIGDYARLNPHACVSGSVTIGPGALVGASATVLQGITVGAGATVGAAACVVRNVPAGVVVKGVPAK